MFIQIVCALVARLLFILHSLIAVGRVIFVKHSWYSFLTLLILPLVIEMVITLKRRRGKDYKWFSPAILFYLISVIPSIWILEDHYYHYDIKDTMSLTKCQQLDKPNIPTNPGSQTGGIPHLDKGLQLLNSTCSDAWKLGLHQTLLLTLIIGKWLLPTGIGISKDQLSQLLLIFVGIAADILEFTSEMLSEEKVKTNTVLVYTILAVWTWSMLQFPLHVAVINTESSDACQNPPSSSLLSTHLADIWNIIISLFIHDGPFFVVRMVVMFSYGVIHQMLVFFTIKNCLVVTLQLYRLYVIIEDYRTSN
ncbi:transmembrane protein 26-like [Polyodon spathula]|uniref:transmembrane protein 26-like n=1 Tax=Polyodon spathula TaxID=7913 RepID=UPI001B7E3986|nr:transmembrane protein 26-like [Polyodon spathula]